MFNIAENNIVELDKERYIRELSNITNNCFYAYDFNGNKIMINSDRKKVIIYTSLIHNPCLLGLKDLNKVYNKYKIKKELTDIYVIFIVDDENDKNLQYLLYKEQNFDFQFLFMLREQAKINFITKIPTYLFFQNDNRISNYVDYSYDYNRLINTIEE